MSRRFQLHLLDGETVQGVEFPSGHVAVNHPDLYRFRSLFTVAESVEILENDLDPSNPLYNAILEWID